MCSHPHGPVDGTLIVGLPWPMDNLLSPEELMRLHKHCRIQNLPIRLRSGTFMRSSILRTNMRQLLLF